MPFCFSLRANHDNVLGLALPGPWGVACEPAHFLGWKGKIKQGKKGGERDRNFLFPSPPPIFSPSLFSLFYPKNEPVRRLHGVGKALDNFGPKGGDIC